jgi:DNA invertase Pin-like site-specific DNA recombinase
MKTVGYVRVSTDKQAERGISLEAQAEKIRAMALVQGAELSEIIVESGESAKSLNRPGMAKLLAMVEGGKVKAVIVAKLDRLTCSVKDLCDLVERFERRGVALVSVAESLDTGSVAGRLVLNIMAAVSQWEREAIGERTRDALRQTNVETGSASATSSSATDCHRTGGIWNQTLRSRPRWRKFRICAAKVIRFAVSRRS